MPKKYANISFTPPKDVRAAARQGLSLHEAGKTGSGLEPITVTWARRIVNGEDISPDKARQGNRWWGRNKRFLDFPKDSPAYAAAMLWFGRPGRRWMAKLTRQMEAADMKKKSLAQLATQIITLRSKANGQQGGAISAPTLSFFPDDHLLGEYAEPTYPQPLTYKSGGHTGAMIALFLPVSTGIHFIQSDPGALPPNELHVTLAYLGKAADLSSRQIMDVHDLMKLVSENHPPLTGHINGCGRFCNGDDDGDPFFVIPDLAALPNLRQILIDGLGSRVINAASDHGFVPHITLTYLPHTEPNPFDTLEKTPISFGAISLVLGDERFDYPLTRVGAPLGKADLIEKIGARHTGAECGIIQKMHDLALELGAECHPLTRRAGARHSHADQGLVQRIHDDCAGLGAQCKALPEKDRVYGSQVLKDGPRVTKHLSGKHSQQAHAGKKAKGRRTKAKKEAPKHTASSISKELPANLGVMDRKKKTTTIKQLSELSTDELAKAFSVNNKKLDSPKNDLELRNALIFGKMLEDATKKKKKGLKAKKADLVIKIQSDSPNYAPASTPQRCANCRFFLGDPGRDYCERFDFTADQDYHCDDWEAQRPDEIPGYMANKGDLAALIEGILILRGGATSGNWGHAGRKGKRGGSGKGGGFGRIGVKPGSKPSRGEVKTAAKNKKLFTESASGKATQAVAKKTPQVKSPAAKPKTKISPAKKVATKKRVAKEDKIPKTDKTAAGDVKNAKATNNKIMSKDSENWQKNMTTAELNGLQAYQGSQFRGINGFLRGGGEVDAATKKDIRNIDKALTKSPLKQDTVVFRNMDESTLDQLLGSDKKKWTGQSYSDKGYTSTSIDPGGTSGFRGISMEIRVPKGTPAGYLANLPGGGVISAGEKELLLGRGQKFRILKVKGGRRPKIIAEVIN